MTEATDNSAGSVPAPQAPAPPQRLLALDAFRGLIMLMMASAGLELTNIAKKNPGCPVLDFVGYHCNHAEWVGCTLWDLIQPAFMFMVGVALALSVAKRRSSGQSAGRMFAHALWRGIALILLAVFLTSNGSKRTEWIFPNVLAQIGWGYPFLFLLSFTKLRTQWLAAFGILFVSWLAFALYPYPPADFNWQSVGVPADWPHFTGFARHWEKNYNFAASFDQWFLNLFPREKPFVFNDGGYQTLNFVPSLATMTFGLLTGQLLRGELAIQEKLKRLAVAGIAGIVLGLALDYAGLCPMVKRIWTPSFALYSGGLVVLWLAGFVAIMEWRGWKRWAFPLVVAGLNPIVLYCLWQLMAGFIKDNIRRHFGQHVFEVTLHGVDLTKSLERATVLLVLWLILLWMYRRKIVIRI